MCPACITAAALLAGGAGSAGGLTALVIKTFRSEKLQTAKVENKFAAQTKSKENYDGNQQN